jgi:hypothetical protein
LRGKIDAEFFKLKKNSAPAATLSKKLTPDATTIFSQLSAKGKKLQTDLAEL